VATAPLAAMSSAAALASVDISYLVFFAWDIMRLGPARDYLHASFTAWSICRIASRSQRWAA